jgi:hypothetical protein
MPNNKEDLERLLSKLDPETRKKWGQYLSKVNQEAEEQGPSSVKEHMEKTLQHLLATAWLIYRCYDEDESQSLLQSLGAIAETLEAIRGELALISKKPEWSN